MQQAGHTCLNFLLPVQTRAPGKLLPPMCRESDNGEEDKALPESIKQEQEPAVEDVLQEEVGQPQEEAIERVQDDAGQDSKEVQNLCSISAAMQGHCSRPDQQYWTGQKLYALPCSDDAAVKLQQYC